MFIGGCHLNDCHYNPEGNYDAMGNSPDRQAHPRERRRQSRPAAARMGVCGRRHPLRRGHERLLREGEKPGPARAVRRAIDVPSLQSRLRRPTELVPYIKLVERERFRVPVRTEEGYRQVLRQRRSSTTLFHELILDKLVMGRIMGFVRKKPVAAMRDRRRPGPGTVRGRAPPAAPDRAGAGQVRPGQLRGRGSESNAGSTKSPSRTDQSMEERHDRRHHRKTPRQAGRADSRADGNPAREPLAAARRAAKGRRRPGGAVQPGDADRQLYKTFSLTPKGRNEVHVCNGMSCHLRGAAKVHGGGGARSPASSPARPMPSRASPSSRAVAWAAAASALNSSSTARTTGG